MGCRHTFMSGLQVKVACTQDVLHVMEIGQRNRSVAETKMNERSSRSHSVLTIIVDGLNNVTGIRTHGCLHLIDLAGKKYKTRCSTNVTFIDCHPLCRDYAETATSFCVPSSSATTCA